MCRFIAIGAEAKHLKSGEVLFEAGDAADGGYVIQDDTLKLALPNADPSDPGITAGAGVLLGELALVTETRRPVTAMAIEPTIVLRIPRSLFRKVAGWLSRGGGADAQPDRRTGRRGR